MKNATYWSRCAGVSCRRGPTIRPSGNGW